jgi:hypothetical protein
MYASCDSGSAEIERNEKCAMQLDSFSSKAYQSAFAGTNKHSL